MIQEHRIDEPIPMLIRARESRPSIFDTSPFDSDPQMAEFLRWRLEFADDMVRVLYPEEATIQ